MDIAQKGYIDGFATLAEAIPDGRVLDFSSATAVVTGVPSAFFNSIFVNRELGDASDLAASQAALEETGLPYCVRLARGKDDHLRNVVIDSRLERLAKEMTPAMVLAPIPDHGSPPEMVIRSGPEVFTEHVQVVTDGFGMPRKLVEAFMRPEIAALEDVTLHVGYVDGLPAATAFGLVLEDIIAVFNVATLAAHRGKGYGGAITMEAAVAGRDHGCRVATLQSSTMGYHLYQSLGFRTVAEYDVWQTPSS